MSPNMDTKDAKIQRFDGSNYNLWSFKMRMYLMSKGLWEYVEGTHCNQDVKDVDTKSQQAHAAIVLNLADSQLLHIISASTAAEALKKLADYHKNKDVASKLLLKEQLATFKYNSANMTEHVSRLEQLKMQLISSGSVTDDEDICATLLRSLPSSYEGLVQAMRLSMYKWTLPDVVNRV